MKFSHGMPAFEVHLMNIQAGNVQVGNVHAKNQKNPYRGSPGTSVTDKKADNTGKGIPTLTSTDVENCNVTEWPALRQVTIYSMTTCPSWRARWQDGRMARWTFPTSSILLIRDHPVCMGLWDLMTMSHVQNEISSPSNRSNCRILIKTPIFAFWIIQKGILPNYAWTITRPTCWKTFTTAIICNIKSLGATKFEKKANVHMCTFYAHCT